MLPKLQQSSLAQSLRRDNPASHLQCNYRLTQAKINSKASSASKTTNAINPGRITTLPKTHTPALATSPKNTYPKKNSKTPTMNQFTNLPTPDPFRNTPDPMETEEKPQAPSKKKQSFKNQSPSQEPSRKEMSLLQSSEDTTTEETYPSELTTKILYPNWSGKFQFSPWITITTCLSSWMEPGKSLTPIDPLPFSALTTYCKKEATRSSP